MKKAIEYREGEEVAREFEKAMKTVFQTPKPKERQQPKAATERKSENRDKD
jgi:hypothetical protein